MKLNGRFIVSSFLVLVSFYSSHLAYSRSTDPLFQKLKMNVGDTSSYEIRGTVCEHVARIELERQYPSRDYTIENGIKYVLDVQSDRDKHWGSRRTLGELDVVVINKKSQQVVLIGEVKCRWDLEKAFNQASDQRSNFYLNLRKYGRNIRFFKESDPSFELDVKQFRNQHRFILISQEEGKEIGFDFALPYTLNELMELRDRLLHCHDYAEESIRDFENERLDKGD